MPLILAGLAGFALGGGAGFIGGGGVDGLSRIVKYGVIGAGLYYGGKHFKVI